MVSIGGPVEVEGGASMLRIPLDSGGTELAEYAEGVPANTQSASCSPTRAECSSTAV